VRSVAGKEPIDLRAVLGGGVAGPERVAELEPGCGVDWLGGADCDH